jgi:hypothetical protein
LPARTETGNARIASIGNPSQWLSRAAIGQSGCGETTAPQGRHVRRGNADGGRTSRDRGVGPRHRTSRADRLARGLFRSPRWLCRCHARGTHRRGSCRQRNTGTGRLLAEEDHRHGQHQADSHNQTEFGVVGHIEESRRAEPPRLRATPPAPLPGMVSLRERVLLQPERTEAELPRSHGPARQSPTDSSANPPASPPFVASNALLKRSPARR